MGDLGWNERCFPHRNLYFYSHRILFLFTQNYLFRTQISRISQILICHAAWLFSRRDAENAEVPQRIIVPLARSPPADLFIFFVPQKWQKWQKFFILLGNLFTIRMAWGVAPFCYFRYFCGTKIIQFCGTKKICEICEICVRLKLYFCVTSKLDSSASIISCRNR